MKRERNISALIYSANVMIKWKFQEVLKEYDINTEQWIILGRLYNKSGELNQKELAKDTNKEQASITRIINKLEKKGLVKRIASERDRREYLIHITDGGRERYDQTLPKMNEIETAIADMVDGDDRDHFIDTLIGLVEGLKEYHL